jgi:hypothetical protein
LGVGAERVLKRSEAPQRGAVAAAPGEAKLVTARVVTADGERASLEGLGGAGGDTAGGGGGGGCSGGGVWLGLAAAREEQEQNE